LKIRILVDGKTYEVEYDPAVHGPIPPGPEERVQSLILPTPPDPSAAQSEADGSKVCRSPVAGVVTCIDIEVGQDVQAGDIILVVEAMKMENNLAAAAASKVKSINVKVGEAVKTGQILIEFQ